MQFGPHENFLRKKFSSDKFLFITILEGPFLCEVKRQKRSNEKRKQEKTKYNSAVRLETLRSYNKL